MSEAIDVQLVPLPSPIRIATPAFLTSLKEVEQAVAALEVKDADSAQQAATLQVRLTQAGKMLEATRAKLKEPVLEQGRLIDKLAKEPALRIERAKSALSLQLTAFENEQRRQAAEAERKRQAEIAALEAKRLAEVAEAKRKADALAAELATKAAAVPELDLDAEPEDAPASLPPEPTETERKIEALKYAPAPVAAKPAGVMFKSRLIIASVDVSALPDLFVVRMSNDAAIRATFCTGWKEGDPIPECKGVAFKVDRVAVSTGRGSF